MTKCTRAGFATAPLNQYDYSNFVTYINVSIVTLHEEINNELCQCSCISINTPPKLSDKVKNAQAENKEKHK